VKVKISKFCKINRRRNRLIEIPCSSNKPETSNQRLESFKGTGLELWFNRSNTNPITYYFKNYTLSTFRKISISVFFSLLFYRTDRILL